MASRFAIVSEDEILVINEAAVLYQQIPRELRNLACW